MTKHLKKFTEFQFFDRRKVWGKAALVLLLMLFQIVPAAFAQKTYHIGNSLTDTNNDYLPPITQSAGKPHTYIRTTVPGAPTDWIWDNNPQDYTPIFAEHAFDHIFTQPFAGHCRSITNEAEYSGKFFTEARRNNPDVQHWLYMQWPSTSLDDCWSDGRGGVDGTAATNFIEAICNFRIFFEKTRELMDSQQPGKSVRIMPSGIALAKLKIEMEAGNVPGLTDFTANTFTDGLHLTDKGSYLVALTHYVGIYGESPVGKVTWKPASMTEEQANIYKQIAWDVVSDYPWAGLGGSGTLANSICSGNYGGDNPPPPITVSGNVEREYWANISGTAVSDIPVETAPTSKNLITSLEGPTDIAENYGTRIRGYIVPSTEGWYNFYIAGDDNAELWFSSGTNPNDKSRIAYVPGWTSPKVWDKYDTQKSTQVYLVKGGKFYFEVLHKEAGGGDHFAVAWTGPEITTPTVIGSANLDQYVTTSSEFSGTYKLSARHSNKVLDLTSSNPEDGANIQQWHDNGTAAQQWVITATTEGYYKIVNKGSNKALEVAGSGTGDGDNVQQMSYTGGNNQQWKIEATSDGFYQIVNRNSGKVVDVAGVSSDDGANVHQWNYVGGGNQQWKLEQLSTATTANLASFGTKTTSDLTLINSSELSVYPNPVTNGRLSIQLTAKEKGTARLTISSLTGQTAIKKAISVDAGQNTLDVSASGLPSGLYLLTVDQGNTRVVRKIYIK